MASEVAGITFICCRTCKCLLGLAFSVTASAIEPCCKNLSPLTTRDYKIDFGTGINIASTANFVSENPISTFYEADMGACEWVEYGSADGRCTGEIERFAATSKMIVECQSGSLFQITITAHNTDFDIESDFIFKSASLFMDFPNPNGFVTCGSGLGRLGTVTCEKL